LRTTCTASGDGAVRCPRTSGCSCSPRCAVGPPTRRTTRLCTSLASTGCFTRRRARSARCGARAIRVGACTGTASPSSSARRSRWTRRLSRRSPSDLRRRRGTWGGRRSWAGSGSACDRIVAAVALAGRLGLPVEWIPISSGARIAMDSGTENLDATARVARRIITFTERGGVIHLIVYGVNVGAQSYWDALATMIGHTRGALIMTPDASMVLTGRAALEASGGVAAEDEVAIGGFERIMGPNGEAQYYSGDLAAAVRTLNEHYRYTYVVPGEAGPRRHRTGDPSTRDITMCPYPAEHGHGFATVGDIFDDATNPGRKRPFAMRAVMQALID